MKTTLLIMAAGIGSRFGGGIKQLEPVGVNDEIIMDYSVHDAIAAGFNKLIFVIRKDIEADFRSRIGNRIEALCSRLDVEVHYAFQDMQDIPAGFQVPADRKKPWGTGQAVLAARELLTEPFIVINADDYYGVDAYRTIYEELVKLPAEGKGTMVGYLLKNTASLHGTVSRGVCKVKDGKLDTIQEALKVQLYPDGHLTDLDTDTDLAPDTVVSMNFWGFMPSIFPALRTYFENFLRGLPDDAVKAECLLPLMVGEEVKAGRMTVSVLHSKDRWFGMTYREDRARVAEDLRQLHESGVYPPSLRD